MSTEKKDRPKVLKGATIRVETGCGRMYITINKDELDENIFEIFTKTGNSGDCVRCQAEAIARSISIGLRYGVPVDEYVKQLKNIKCEKKIFAENGTIESCPDAIAQTLEKATNGDIDFHLPEKAEKAINTTPKASVEDNKEES